MSMTTKTAENSMRKDFMQPSREIVLRTITLWWYLYIHTYVDIYLNPFWVKPLPFGLAQRRIRSSPIICNTVGKILFRGGSVWPIGLLRRLGSRDVRFVSFPSPTTISFLRREAHLSLAL